MNGKDNSNSALAIQHSEFNGTTLSEHKQVIR